MSADPINPDHYRLTGPDGTEFQVVDVLKAVLTPEQFVGYCRGSKLAYDMRAGRKPGAPLVEDNRKSGWFGRELDDFLIAQAQRAKPELTEEPDDECGCPVCFDADGTNGETWSADRQDLEQAIGAVRYELLRATLKHPPIASAHEGYAILAEELAELLEEIRRQEPDRAAMRKECDQLAAMCLRFRRDVLTDD